MKIYVTMSRAGDNLMFRSEEGKVWWKSYWRGCLHVLSPIFQGHDLEFVE